MQLQKYLAEALSTECFSSSFLHRLKKSTKSWSFCSLQRGKDTTLFTPVGPGFLQEPVFGCGRAEQLLGDSPESDVWRALAVRPSDLHCQPRRHLLQVLQRMGNTLTGEGCTHEKSLVLLSELRVILWLELQDSCSLRRKYLVSAWQESVYSHLRFTGFHKAIVFYPSMKQYIKADQPPRLTAR